MNKLPTPRELVVAYVQTFSTDSGKIVLGHLIRETFDKLSYVQGDAYATAVNEGERRCVLRILRTLQKSKDEKFLDSLKHLEEKERENV